MTLMLQNNLLLKRKQCQTCDNQCTLLLTTSAADDTNIWLVKYTKAVLALPAGLCTSLI